MQTISYGDQTEEKEGDCTALAPAPASRTPDKPHAKQSVLRRNLVSLGLISIGVFAGWYIRSSVNTDSRISLNELTRRPATQAISISTSSVSYRKLQRHVDAIGSIHAFEDLTVAAKSEGRVLRIYQDMSDVVEPNSLLLETDPTDMQLAVNQAERGLKAECERWGFEVVPSETVDLEKLPSVRSAKMRLELMQSKLTRLSMLIKTQSVSPDEFEQVKSDARVAESEWDNQRHLARASLATIRLRESDLQVAKQRLLDTRIFAPNPPTDIPDEDRLYCVAKRMVSEGSLVRPGDPLFRLVLGRSVKVRLTLQELHSASIAVGQSVELESFVGGSVSKGKVTRVSPVIDPSNRTFIAEVAVKNELGHLKPGGFARARILVEEDVVAMTVPLTALDSFAGVHKVFVIEDGIATEHQVKPGYQQEDWIEIIEPILADGTVLATSSQRLLSTGITVMDRNARQAAP